MKHWATDYLAQCLSSVPDHSYRKRLKQELTDHLDALAASLERAGYAPQEARAMALDQMGDPTELSTQYNTAWKLRSQSPKYYLPRLKEGIVQMWAFCMLCRLIIPITVLPLLEQLFDDDGFFYWMFYDFYWFMVDHLPLFYALFIFLPGLIHGAKDLNRGFDGHPHKGQMLGLGLLIGWTVEKIPLFPLFISLFLLQEPPWLLLSDTAAWFDIGYYYIHPEYYIASLAMTALVWLILMFLPSSQPSKKQSTPSQELS